MLSHCVAHAIGFQTGILLGLSGQPHEIIGIHDARRLGSATIAARGARGELPIFSPDDVEIVSSDLAGAVTRAAVTVDVIGGRRDVERAGSVLARGRPSYPTWQDLSADWYDSPTADSSLRSE